MAAELIIQLQQPDGSFSCELYENFPGTRSAYVAVSFVDTGNSQAEAELLKRELVSAVMSLDPGVIPGLAPCGGPAMSFSTCQALRVPETIKLLLVVSDGGSINLPVRVL